MKREYGLNVAPPAVILKGSEPQQFSVESLPKQLFQNSSFAIYICHYAFAFPHLHPTFLTDTQFTRTQSTQNKLTAVTSLNLFLFMNTCCYQVSQ